jgi:segregation and condensation protein A
MEACVPAGMRRSACASTFAASLELAREGKIELRQEKAFAPIWLRPTETDPGAERAA